MTNTDSLEHFIDNEFGKSLNSTVILEDLEFLDDWEDRYGYIIDLGKSLPAFPASEKNELNLVRGCQSQVWLIHKQDPESGKIYLLIDSDALIVRGLAAIVMATLNAKTPEQLLAVDIEDLFGKMDLIRHISPTRGNGLRSMVDKIQNIARHC
jgi:cysteine desulfuration protein SufE